MKKYLNKKTILLIISILIIVAGTITLCLLGFEKSIQYKTGTKIEIYIPKGYEKQEIIDIANESFNNSEILFLEIEKTNQVAGIKITEEYSKEQLENYINKISEKYDIDKESMEYHEILIPETKISTLIKPYVLPILLITILSLIYIIIRNLKENNKIKRSLNILKILVITICLYFSAILLLRLQFTIYTMPLASAIYIITLLTAINKKCE